MLTVTRSDSVARSTWASLLLACLSLVSLASYADDQADGPDPASRVARISFLRGPVYVQTADDDSWSEANINRPLTNGDQLWTDAQGRSELQMGSTTVQVDANTQLRIAQLNDDELQLVVTQGLVNVRVRHLDSNDRVEISTPNAAVTPVEPGNYRIEIADRDDVTVVKVSNGAAQISGARQDFKLRAGEQLSLRGGERVTADFDQLARADEFDQWSNERNDRAERVAAARYVSADVIGYEDLDEYGSWRHYDDYGYVWAPTRIQSGWAPYRYGHWAWVSPWGWTWMDDAPWGFAPFHYGRWAMLDRRWCWVPGPRTVRAVYAPALVAWVGTPGVNVSINVGHQPVGWIPLGPREVYRPYYRGSRAYINRVNLSNARFDHDEFERGYRRQPHDNDYQNRRAVSVVRADALRTAQPVSRHLVRANQAQLQPLAAQPVARPERNQASERGRQFTPPVMPNNRQVITRGDNGNRADNVRGAREQGPREENRLNNPAPAAPDNSRMIDNSRARGRDGSSDNPARSNDGRFNNDASRGEPRNSVAPDRRPEVDPRFSRDRDSSGPGPAPTPRTEAPAPPPERLTGPPAGVSPPDNAPRVRTEYGIRNEAQLRHRESARAVEAAPAPQPPPAMRIEHGHDMRIPNEPAPMRSAPPQPAPQQPSPRAMSPRMQAEPEAPRSPRGREDNGRGRDHDRDGR
jgi:hypothetical protein